MPPHAQPTTPLPSQHPPAHFSSPYAQSASLTISSHWDAPSQVVGSDQVPIEARAVVLCQDVDLEHTGVDAVAHDHIDQPWGQAGEEEEGRGAAGGVRVDRLTAASGKGRSKQSTRISAYLCDPVLYHPSSRPVPHFALVGSLQYVVPDSVACLLLLLLLLPLLRPPTEIPVTTSPLQPRTDL